MGYKESPNIYVFTDLRAAVTIFIYSIINMFIMKKIMAVLSDESYGILKRYQKEEKIANLDTTLDNFIK